MRSGIFAIFLFTCITRVLGFVFLPALLKFSPLLLIILSPFLHHLILTSTLIEPLLFLFIGIVVSLCQCAVGYEFGRHYGLKSFKWCKRHQLLSQSKIDLISSWIRYSTPMVLFLVPGPLIAMVTGVFHLRRKHFFIFMIPSQVLWVCACFFLGTLLEVYISLIKAFLFEHWIFMTLFLVSLKVLERWWKKWHLSL